jgi:hypothetical protein
LQSAPFLTVHLGDVLVLGTGIIAYLAYRFDRKKDNAVRKQEWEATIREQTRMHTENQEQLKNLSEFHRAQLIVNEKRDIQIAQLSQQTATLTQMAAGMERRLQMIEDKL